MRLKDMNLCYLYNGHYLNDSICVFEFRNLKANFMLDYIFSPKYIFKFKIS